MATTEMKSRKKSIESYISTHEETIYGDSKIGICIRDIMRYARKKGCKVAELSDEEVKKFKV